MMPYSRDILGTTIYYRTGRGSICTVVVAMYSSTSTVCMSDGAASATFSCKIMVVELAYDAEQYERHRHIRIILLI